MLLPCVVAVAIVGCKKSDSIEGGGTDETVVALPPIDLNPDGTIGAQGLQKIESQAKAPKLVVAFVRTQLSDEGLNQLAGFRNLKRVEAIGSRVTNAGIEKLRGSIPGVTVSH